MPRLPIDYSKTIIYKIVCNDLNICDLYVGSTTDFTRRKRQHKHNCNIEKSNLYNLKVYQMIRQNGGWSNWSMIEIEKYKCNDSNEAHARERHHYELLQCNMNTNVPNQTKEEYYYNNKQKIKEQQKNYAKANKEKITEHKKEYYKNNKEKLKQNRILKKQNQQNENIVL